MFISNRNKNKTILSNVQLTISNSFIVLTKIKLLNFVVSMEGEQIPLNLSLRTNSRSQF